MKSQWLEHKTSYDGSQLRPLYAYLQHQLLGDSIIGWRGPCEVAMEHMVDGEDRLANAAIRGADMLHFIVEKFDCSLLAAVALQRLLSAIAMDLLRELSSEDLKGLRREGDDIFWGTKKFSISIATISPTSALIHFAVNVSNEGTPVETCCLQDFGVEPKEYGRKLLANFQDEATSIIRATRKVLPRG